MTSAAESGADALKMAEVSATNPSTPLRRYVRRAKLFKAHAGAKSLEYSWSLVPWRLRYRPLEATDLSRI